MNKRIYLGTCAALISFAITADGAAAADCQRYGSSTSLAGKLVTFKAPGPPNYKSAMQGDSEITVWLLSMDKPLCVQGKAGGAPTENVDIIQLEVTKDRT